ncbi:MAG: peptidase domain-containing ABC transporter [Lachnospiraceae bacterium]|nr:peptidase domain-containing ABC transporter [Lachnospiraceae bacterium]
MKIKLIRQHDTTDCGVACLAMITNYYGAKYSIQYLRELTQTDKRGTSLQELAIAGEKIGFEAVSLAGTLVELKEAVSTGEIQLPFIIHLKDFHFAVVADLSEKTITILDPGEGKKKITLDEFNEIWSGYIVSYTPKNIFVKNNFSESKLLRVVKILKPIWKKIFIILGLSLIVYFFGIYTSFTFEAVINEFSLANPQLTQTENSTIHSHKSDSADSEKNDDDENSVINVIGTEKLVKYLYSKSGNIGAFFVVLMLMYIISSTISYIRGKIVIKISKLVDVSLTYTYFLKVLKIPLITKNSRSDGDYISRLNDTYRIRYAISNATVSILLDTVLGILGALILYKIDKFLFACSLLVLMLYFIGALFFRKKLNISNRKVMESNAEMQSYFKEVLCGYDSIKANALCNETENIGTKKYNKMIQAFYLNDLLGVKESTLMGLIEMFGNALILWLGFSKVLSGDIQLGSFISFTTLLSAFTEPFKNIIQLQPTIQSASVSLDRLFDIFDMNDEDICKNGEIFKTGDIIFKEVSFKHKGGIGIFNNFSCRIPEGSTTAVIGSSGSGKTTLIRLINRLYVPDTGEIYIGNYPIKDFQLNEYRRSIYSVDNAPFMFENTIRYNLVENQSEISDDELMKACCLCCIDDFIMDTPLMFDTPIIENGLSLSQGQRQRLGLARAILHNPKILILDEAMSNIGSEMANKIFYNLQRELKGTTIILVTHMENLIELCDNVIQLG